MKKLLQHVAHIPLLQFLLPEVVDTGCSIKLSVSMMIKQSPARANKVICNIVGILFYGQPLSVVSAIVW